MVTINQYKKALKIISLFNEQEMFKIEHTEKWDVLEKSIEDNFITLNPFDNNFIETNKIVNANILKIKRNSDNAIFSVSNNIKKHMYKTKHNEFYITGFWYNDILKTINVCGNYPNGIFSNNICYLEDLL